MFNFSALGQFSTELENILNQTQVIKFAIFGNPHSGKSVFLLRYHPVGTYRRQLQINTMTFLDMQPGDTKEEAIIRRREEMLQKLRTECGRCQNATDIVDSHKSDPSHPEYFRENVYGTDGAYQCRSKNYKTSVRCMNPHFNDDIYRMLENENENANANMAMTATEEEEEERGNNDSNDNNGNNGNQTRAEPETETEIEQKYVEETVDTTTATATADTKKHTTNMHLHTTNANMERNKHILESDGILVMFDYTDTNGLQSLRPLLDTIFHLREYQMVKDMTNATASPEMLVHYPIMIVGSKYDFPKHMRRISFAEQILFANEYNVSFARFDASAYNPALRIMQSLVYDILMFLKYQALSDKRRDTLMRTSRRMQTQTDAEGCKIL